MSSEFCIPSAQMFSLCPLEENFWLLAEKCTILKVGSKTRKQPSRPWTSCWIRRPTIPGSRSWSRPWPQLTR